MRMKIADIIKRATIEDMAQIIGSIVMVNGYGFSAEQALKMEYKNTLKTLQSEMEIDYRETNADRIRSMSDEDLVEFIVGLNEHCLAGIGLCDCSGAKHCSDSLCKNKTRKWLHTEVKEGGQI